MPHATNPHQVIDLLADDAICAGAHPVGSGPSPVGSPITLEANSLSFSYPTRDTKAAPIFENISLNLQPGQFVGLLGPNGTGKSTLLGVLAGDLQPTKGTVFLNGEPLTNFSQRDLALYRSVMPQAHDFPFSYLVRDVVAMGRLCHRGSPAAVSDEQAIEYALARADITHLAEREVTRLSGGEKARVTLARVLAQDTPIVFLDEPTAAFDILHQQHTMQICRDLAREGRIVVCVMHDIQLAASYCDSIALLCEGSLRALGSPIEVLTGSILSEVYAYPICVTRLPGGELAILPQVK